MGEKVANKKSKDNLKSVVRSAMLPCIIFVLILCVGISVIIYGAAPSLFRDKNFVPTNATVVKYEWRYVTPTSKPYSGGNMPFPVYQYVFEGKEYVLESKTAVNPQPFKEGETITIYVNPSDPTDIVTPVKDKFYILFGIMAIILSLVALCILTLRPILAVAYPNSYWPKVVTLYIPSMIFLWSLVIVLAVNINFSGVFSVILLLALAALASFISAIMIKDMIYTLKEKIEEKRESSQDNK